MKGIFTVILFTVACGTSSAQVVFKCLDGQGNAHYQSGACPPGTTLAKTWESQIDPGPTPARPATGNSAAGSQSQRITPARRRGRAAPDYRTRRATGRISAGRSRCEAAKEKRQATLAAVGLKRNFDLLRKLDDQVSAACK